MWIPFDMNPKKTWEWKTVPYSEVRVYWSQLKVYIPY